jgi:amidase
MARTAADLGLALDVVAGPNEERAGIGHRLAMPPARHDNLKDFRVLVVDSHPLVPTAATVRTAIDRLSERLDRAGVKAAPASPLLPDLANSARVFMRLLFSLRGPNLPPDDYEEARRAADAFARDDNSLVAERIRGTVMSHRDWSAADAARTRLRQQWRASSGNGMSSYARWHQLPPFRMTIPRRSTVGASPSTAGIPFATHSLSRMGRPR